MLGLLALAVLFCLYTRRTAPVPDQNSFAETLEFVCWTVIWLNIGMNIVDALLPVYSVQVTGGASGGGDDRVTIKGGYAC